jgi:hypothetical protein
MYRKGQSAKLKHSEHHGTITGVFKDGVEILFDPVFVNDRRVSGGKYFYRWYMLDNVTVTG